MERVDKYGHCVVCHKNMIVERVVDGKVINMFTPDRSSTEFMLNDGSRMKVAICTGCKNSRDLGNPKVQEEIMESVINGWQLEADALIEGIARADGSIVRWPKDKAIRHMEEYRKKNIMCHSENLSNESIERNKRRVEKLMQDNKKIIDEREVKRANRN